MCYFIEDVILSKPFRTFSLPPRRLCTFWKVNDFIYFLPKFFGFVDSVKLSILFLNFVCSSSAPFSVSSLLQISLPNYLIQFLLILSLLIICSISIILLNSYIASWVKKKCFQNKEAITLWSMSNFFCFLTLFWIAYICFSLWCSIVLVFFVSKVFPKGE